VGIYKYVYTHRVDVCVCVYCRIDTPGSHVGMYVFPYIRTEFMFAFIHVEFTCGCVYVSVYIHRCMFPYTYTEFTRGYVCISVYSHRVHVVCIY